MDNIKYWLWLVLVFGSSEERIWEIMSRFETASEAYHGLRADCGMFRLTSDEKSNIKSTELSHAEEIIEQCRKKGIGIVSYSSEKYPENLRYIASPPAILYYKGNIDCLCGTNTVTCVGTRRASDYSIFTADRICTELAENGIVLISGFAMGIDIRANISAISRNMPSACVMGCGLDVNYPSDNFKYRDMIINSGGVLISEFNLATPPLGINFPRRNRILSALGNATIVFQASAKSGALITADLSAEQGKEVFCLPPANIFSYEYSGNAELIRNGAIPLLSAKEVIDYINMDISENPYILTDELFIDDDEYDDDDEEFPDDTEDSVEDLPDTEDDSAGEDNNSVVDLSDGEESFVEDDTESRIARLMSGGAVHADVIAQKLNLNPTELMTVLTEMEMAGIIRSLPGKMYEIKAKG
ncbi:MAG: DNA-processing protein DprA [Ruminococcus flavefaciens]|nr:DNA-processing protein DprA [Ruminococcus flavefaciens]MCM1230557.1 DNA-processing protein DprA [Ruminococcus flavefaciens]